MVPGRQRKFHAPSLPLVAHKLLANSDEAINNSTDPISVHTLHRNQWSNLGVLIEGKVMKWEAAQCSLYQTRTSSVCIVYSFYCILTSSLSCQ